MLTQKTGFLTLGLLLLTGIFIGSGFSALSAARPDVYDTGDGYYIQYPNVSHAYRHGVRTPFNSYPTIPQVPSVPSMPNLPRVPIPTMADLMPNPQNTPQPYIGPDGIGYYGDTGPVDDWNTYVEEEPGYHTDDYSDAEAAHDQMNALSDELQYSTDKQADKKHKSKSKSKKSKKSKKKTNKTEDE